MVKTGKFAVAQQLECYTVEHVADLPRVRIEAELVLSKGSVHHVNTEELKKGLQDIVQASVWLCDTTQEAASNEK